MHALRMKTVVVVTAGPDVPWIELPEGATVIAADGGADSGYAVDLAVGDFDSVSSETLARLGNVERHPAEKDATDLELALAAAMREEPDRILVVGSPGGRLDHLVGVFLLLAAGAYAGVQVDAQLGEAALHVVRGTRTIHGSQGELISLFAVHGPADGVETHGLVYPLRGETLEPGTSRGVSNVFGAAQARITVAAGVVVAVRPSGSASAGTAS